MVAVAISHHVKVLDNRLTRNSFLRFLRFVQGRGTNGPSGGQQKMPVEPLLFSLSLLSLP